MSNPLTSDVARLLARDLAGLEREVRACPSDDLLWATTAGITNSVGNLAWHVAGNLQHYIGAVLGRTGYARDRYMEFARRSGTRDAAASELAKAAEVVARVLPLVDDDVLAAPFPGELPRGLVIPTHAFLVQLAIHAGFHLGQAGYLRRALTGDQHTTGPIPLIP